MLPGVNDSSLQEALIAIDIDVDFPEEEKKEENLVNLDEDLRKRYKKFFENIKELEDCPEELALAAIVACDCPCDESDLIMWCLRNKQNEDVIQDMCDEGAKNPKYVSLFPQENTTDTSTPVDEDEKQHLIRYDRGFGLKVKKCTCLLCYAIKNGNTEC